MTVQGNEEFKQQNYAAALKFYTKAIYSCPKNGLYYSNRAECYMMLGNYKDALKDSRDAVKFHGDVKFHGENVKEYDRIIKYCMSLGDITGVDEAIAKLANIDPKNETCKEYQEKCKCLNDLRKITDECYGKRDIQEARMCCVPQNNYDFSINLAINKFVLIFSWKCRQTTRNRTIMFEIPLVKSQMFGSSGSIPVREGVRMSRLLLLFPSPSRSRGNI